MHKTDENWQITPSLRKLIGQILRIDVTQHDDLADAQTDGFIPQLWAPPMSNPGIPQDEGSVVRRPWDDDLKNVGKPPSNEELAAWDLERQELEDNYMHTPGHGWDDSYLPPREPV
jgi:hypothetical protein